MELVPMVLPMQGYDQMPENLYESEVSGVIQILESVEPHRYVRGIIAEVENDQEPVEPRVERYRE